MIKREIIEVTIDEIKFKITEFNWKDSLKVQKTVGAILTPILNVLGLKSGDEDDKRSLLDKLEIKDLGTSIKECLLSIEDPFSFFKEVFKETFVVKKNQTGEEGPVQLNTDDMLNEVFHKKTMTAFKLVFEVLKANELLFSKGAGGISQVIGTLMNTMQK